MPDAGSSYLNRPVRRLFADGTLEPRTGIYARTLLPSPAYDHLFTLKRAADGRCLCVYNVFQREDDRHWWEEVPAPKGWNDAA